MAKNGVKAAVIRHSEKAYAHVKDESSDVAAEAKIKTAEAKRKLHTIISDSVAASDIFHKNWPIAQGKKLFPDEWRLQYSDLFYPYAEGGPLFIDTPGPHDVQRCEKKFRAYAQAGVRYVYIKNGDSVNDVLMRLETAAKNWPTVKSESKAGEAHA